MQYHQMKTGKIIVPQAGGAIFINDDGGALVTEVGMTPGMHDASQYMFLMEPDWSIDATEGITLFVPAGNRIQRMPYGPGATDTSANPDFQPSSADQQMRRLQATVEKLVKRADRSEQREKEAQRMLAERTAKQKQEEVIDDEKPKEQKGGEAETPGEQENEAAE